MFKELTSLKRSDDVLIRDKGRGRGGRETRPLRRVLVSCQPRLGVRQRQSRQVPSPDFPTSEPKPGVCRFGGSGRQAVADAPRREALPEPRGRAAGAGAGRRPRGGRGACPRPPASGSVPGPRLPPPRPARTPAQLAPARRGANRPGPRRRAGGRVRAARRPRPLHSARPAGSRRPPRCARPAGVQSRPLP